MKTHKIRFAVLQGIEDYNFTVETEDFDNEAEVQTAIIEHLLNKCFPEVSYAYDN